MEALREATSINARRNKRMPVDQSSQHSDKTCLHPTKDVIATLQERLLEMEIFELTKDGQIQSHHLTVRGLYKYVMHCIVSLPRQVSFNLSRDQDEVYEMSSGPCLVGNAAPASKHASFASEPDERSRGKPPRKRRNRRKKTNYERLGGFLHPRDMRRLTTPISANNEPEIMVRRHVMLFNYNPVRAIVTRQRLLLVLPEAQADADWVVDHLVTRIQGLPSSNEKGTHKSMRTKEKAAVGHNMSQRRGLFGKLKVQADDELTGDETEDSDNDFSRNDDESSEGEEWDEMRKRQWIKLPFELQCVDSLLSCVNEFHERDTAELAEESTKYTNFVLQQKSHGEDHFRIIRMIKDGRGELATRVKGFCASITRVLNEDEDMALMNLTRLLTNPQNFVRPVSPQVLENESDEPELILESHLQAGYSLMNTLDLIAGQLESASDFYEQQLDATRNKILLANMLLTTAALCLAAASVVGSFLGMNVGVPGEGESDVFMPIVAATMGGSLLLGLVILVALFATGTIQRTPQYAIDDDDI